jgi:hypothetical protein
MLCVLTASLPLSTEASNWYVLLSSDDPELSVDTESISKKGRYTKAWFRFKHSFHQPPNAHTSKPFTEERLLLYADCAERTTAIIQVAFYDRINSVSNSQVELGKAVFQEPIPDTMGEGMMKFLCAPSAKPKTAS